MSDGITITESLVRAVATSYTADQLKQMITQTTQQLISDPTFITSAAAGGGTSYSRTERARLDQLIELYQRALDYQSGNITSAYSSTATPVRFDLPPVIPVASAPQTGQ